MKALRGQATKGQEYHLIRDDGSSSDILFSACPITTPRSKTPGMFCSFTDISEHKRKERALREEAVLNERSRMAADIHDTVVQGLNAIVLQLEAAEQELPENPEQARERLCRACNVARSNLAEARRSMWTVSQESFGNEDPAAALGFLARKLFEGTPIRLQLSLQEEAGRLTPETRVGLVGIGKEAMTNVLKHAQATKVRIELAYSEREVRLSVHDNGRGFVVVPFPSSQRGFGLFGFQARAEFFGGKVVVHSQPGRGTRVLASVPFRSNLARAAA